MTRDTIICMAALFCIGWITGMVRLLILHLNFGALAARMFAQVIDCAGAVNNLEFTDAELAEIDKYADEEAINLWAKSSEL